jgi:hypothetical protein
MLHVTNGDSAVSALRAAGMSGDLLPWRDVLHDGPVPAGLPPDDLSVERARWLAAQGWGDEGEILCGIRERDAALAGFARHDEVVLWFEHDLYDQLQLLQVLDFLAPRVSADTRLTLVGASEYLGPASPDRIVALFGERQPVTPAQLALGARAWAAFRDPAPTGLASLVDADTSPLPHLRAAIRRHLEQFPSVRNGLSRSEQQALEAIEAGACTPKDAYVASHHQREDAVWMGDATFAGYLADLGAGRLPLVTFQDGSPVAAPRGDRPNDGFWSRELALTAAGRDVLHGRADRVRLNGMDRWLGGVHLAAGEPDWRWDVDAGTVVRPGDVQREVSRSED